MNNYIRVPIDEIDMLDEGIKEYVRILLENNVETFESCQGGIGHPFCEPTIRFWGDQNEGLRVSVICLKNNLPIYEIRRCFSFENNEIQSPFWEVIFKPITPKEDLRMDWHSGLFTA